MSEEIFYSATEGKPSEPKRFKESANTLFNFMREYEYLEAALAKMALMPRYVNENVEYLNLQNEQGLIRNLCIPMLCFCDINFHKILPHCVNYGNFGIGLAKDKVPTDQVQPVNYLNKDSPVAKDLSAGINSLLNGGEKREGIAGDALLTVLKFSKPVEGKQVLNGVPEPNTIFHDEHEWRHIPNLDPSESDSLLIDNIREDDAIMHNQQSLNVLSSQLQSHPENNLKLTADNINYIIVEDKSFVEKLLSFIDKTFEKQETKLKLASKITDLSILKGDW